LSRYYDTSEIRDLIQGNFRFFNCLECMSRGWIWVDGDDGSIVNGPDPSRDQTEFYKDECEACKGLGGKLHIGER
jgi:hypothetical protein